MLLRTGKDLFVLPEKYDKIRNRNKFFLQARLVVKDLGGEKTHANQ